jgi:PAS domain S-box-containing protein/putative nucleotidyltransferase with HDIG domain
MANWLFGQVRDETHSEESIRAYAHRIGADEILLMEAYKTVPSMSPNRFEAMNKYLYLFANQLSKSAYNNLMLTRSISSMNKVKELLRNSEERYRALFENTGAATFIIGEDLTIHMHNTEAQRLLGCKKEDVNGKKITDFISDEQVETIKENHRLRLDDSTTIRDNYLTEIIDNQGNKKECLLYIVFIPETKETVTTLVDLTEFHRIDRALKATNAVNMAILRAKDEQDLLQNVCQKIVEVGRYRMAWVGYVENYEIKTLHPMAYAGFESGYLNKLKINLTDSDAGKGLLGKSIKNGQISICRNIITDPMLASSIKEEALSREYKSVISLPLLFNGKGDSGALCIYSDEIDVFDMEEVKLLTAMTSDLVFGIKALRLRSERDKTRNELEISLNKTERVLMQTVSSLGNIMQIRDPYTAGHQKRVTELASTIAKEMNFSSEQLKEIAVAGNLHDIGKTSVPSEILNKPGKLSEIEFALIQTHPHAGYEIVKNIEFPWPVADVILQHHEKMNGSGYPRGLVGDEILIEARIIAVADVVEAMASHRPYRPGLGIEKALEEIEHNRGILYDSKVVDICLKLFREKNYKLE